MPQTGRRYVIREAIFLPECATFGLLWIVLLLGEILGGLGCFLGGDRGGEVVYLRKVA